MPGSSRLTDQLAALGVHLPAWPEEPHRDNASEHWIQQGKAYAEGVRLSRAQLRNMPESTKDVVDQFLRHLQDTSELKVWDQLVYSAIKPEVQGSPDYERWQTCTKLIRSSALTPAQLLGITLEMARQQRLAAAAYGLKRLLNELTSIKSFEYQQLCCELVSAANTHRLLQDAKASSIEWFRTVKLHQQLTSLLVTAFAADVTGDIPQSGRPIDDMALSKLDDINNCLVGKGVHGHAEFIALCQEKLAPLLKGWHGERPWIVEVGCSREIIEGQNSTVQLLALAKKLNLPFAGLDLDSTNIEALGRDYRKFNATWITGKGEKILQTWNKPIAAIYLDAYDFWHASHSELRQKSYLKNYGSKINDAECHTMHLEAARHCSKLIPQGGLIGLDDSWLENGQWKGKGALALPWLLGQGWTLLSTANRGTVLLNTGGN